MGVETEPMGLINQAAVRPEAVVEPPPEGSAQVREPVKHQDKPRAVKK